CDPHRGVRGAHESRAEHEPHGSGVRSGAPAVQADRDDLAGVHSGCIAAGRESRCGSGEPALDRHRRHWRHAGGDVHCRAVHPAVLCRDLTPCGARAGVREARAASKRIRGLKRLLIFDFDGVLADSEILANAVLAEMVTELGVPTTTEDSLRRYVGKRLQDVILTVEQTVGRPMAGDFVESYQQRTLARLRAEVRLVEGALDFLDAFAQVPRCIASSSPPDRIAACLETLGL